MNAIETIGHYVASIGFVPITKDNCIEVKRGDILLSRFTVKQDVVVVEVLDRELLAVTGQLMVGGKVELSLVHPLLFDMLEAFIVV